MTNKIDWTRPIRAGDGRPAFVMSDNVRLEAGGARLVAVALAQHQGGEYDTERPLYRTYDTNEHRPMGRMLGRSVTFQNIPDVQSVFIRYNIDGDTSSHNFDPLGSSVVSMKLTFTDGVATDVQLVRTNRDKARTPLRIRQ